MAPNTSTAISLFSMLIAVTSAAVVETALGTIRGWTGLSREGREYSAFTKIPYAKPPVGPLRFKNPVPYGKWEGELLATEDSPKCLQIDRWERVQSSELAIRGTEDCLYLNVYVPKDVSEPMPVLFRIHGGAFQQGSTGPRHSADFMMDENVILVTVSFRVNVFGFLSLENDTIPGNFGLKDAALALIWVKENVKSFGGDPGRVLIFGESSGGASAQYLLVSPLTRDLVIGAVSTSGTITTWRSLGLPGTVRNKSLEFVRKIGCSESDILTCLQSLNQTELLAQYNNTEFWGVYFRPCVEPDAPGAVIPVDPRSLSSKSPWITSFTNGEFTNYYAFHPAKEVSTNLEAIFGPNPGYRTTLTLQPDKWDKIKARYLGNDTADFRRAVAQIAGDLFVVYPAFDAIQRFKGVKYLYTLEYRGQFSIIEMNSYIKLNITEAGHVQELIFEFNMTPTVNNSHLNPQDREVSKQFIKLLTNFAYFQNPTPCNSSLRWTPWAENEMLRITSNGEFIMADPQYYEKKHEIYRFWNDILSQSISAQNGIANCPHLPSDTAADGLQSKSHINTFNIKNTGWQGECFSKNEGKCNLY